MGKKKNKFKRALPNRHLDQSTHTTGETTSSDAVETVNHDSDHHEKIKYEYVRNDVRKLMIYLGIVIILLVAAYFVNIKTTVFQSLGDWIYRIANIQTQ